MRVIAHLSDLHFGKIDHELLEPLRRKLESLEPDLIVVSGDLTQRAKPEQFREARRYLDSLPKPQIVVPGNHDIPLYNVFQRFLTPLHKYKKFITIDLEPAFIDWEIAVVGVNTARSAVFKGGRINEEQVAAVKAKICKLPHDVTKIVVTHHPFDMPDHWDDQHQLAGRAAMAMKSLAECGADVYISGHMHKSHSGEPSTPFDLGGFNALIVAAGTATSTRGRGEQNSFNTLRISGDNIVVEHYEWEEKAKGFDLKKSANYKFTDRGWVAGV